MFDKILLFRLKSRLKQYKKNCEWYHRQGAEPNWYDEQGIPDLEKEIIELENKMKSKKTINKYVNDAIDYKRNRKEGDI